MTFFSVQILKVALILALSILVAHAVNAKDHGTDAVKKGAVVYGGTCIACHGENGKGEIPGVPDFTSAKGPLVKTDAVLLDHMMNGFQSPGSDLEMPALGGDPDLTEQDIKNVLAFLRAKFQHKKK